MISYLCVTPEREQKSGAIMEALARGIPGAKIVLGAPPDDGLPFAVYGQVNLAERILPQAMRQGRPFWQIDNGYWNPPRKGVGGSYRMTYRGPSPILLPPEEIDQGIGLPDMRPWRTGGAHILLAFPGKTFGVSMGIDAGPWLQSVKPRLRAVTRRQIIERHKGSELPLSAQLSDAWALVTHSSNVGVDAVLAGIPVFVEPSSPAAPVGNLDLGQIEAPVMPERLPWLQSLAMQQFSLAKMANGTALSRLEKVRRAVDGV